jgi:hypothetical protein
MYTIYISFVERILIFTEGVISALIITGMLDAYRKAQVVDFPDILI